MKVTITGDFTEEDLKEIAKVLRLIERKNPNLTFTMLLEKKGLSKKDAVELVKNLFDSVKLFIGG